MNEIARTPAEPQILRLGPDRASVSGTVEQVSGVVERLRAAGRLATVSDPVPNGTPGGVLVTVRMLSPQRRLPATTPQRRTRWTRNRILAAVGAVAVVLVLCGLALRAAFLWTVAHAATIGSVALMLVVLGVVALANSLSGGRIVDVLVRVKVK
jgi:hypothetical protein